MNSRLRIYIHTYTQIHTHADTPTRKHIHTHTHIHKRDHRFTHVYHDKKRQQWRQMLMLLCHEKLRLKTVIFFVIS